MTYEYDAFPSSFEDLGEFKSPFNLSNLCRVINSGFFDFLLILSKTTDDPGLPRLLSGFCEYFRDRVVLEKRAGSVLSCC